MGNNMNKILPVFFTESREMLLNLEQGLLAIEKDRHDDDALNEVFRAAHTIKGSAGMFDFRLISEFTHKMENLLDEARKKNISMDSASISLLLECRDHIEDLLEMYEQADNAEKVSPDRELELKHMEYLKKMDSYLHDQISTGQAADEIKEKPEEPVDNKCWHISLRLHKKTFHNGIDPQSLIRYLEDIGEIVNITVITDEKVTLETIDPEMLYLGYEINFKADIDKEQLESIFEFTGEDSTVRILPPNSSLDEYSRLLDELLEEPLMIGEILRRTGSLTQKELDEALNRQEKQAEESQGPYTPIGEIIAEEKMVQKPLIEEALKKQENTKKKLEKNNSTIRIEADKLDDTINLVGELVITGSRVKQLAQNDVYDKTNFIQAVDMMSKLIENIRDSTMNLRMVQIGETLLRYERVVRDLSRKSGKEIRLNISGGDTELDKTLVEKITDPLMHLVRNAVDHGIDPPDQREKAGKPRMGTIALNAYHETGNVVIEITDDGEGLNRDLIYEKAVAQNLIEPGQKIEDQDLFQYIFYPGFSTAKEITNISGRGVGMDVVKKNIESLGGNVVLKSENGKGTSITIHLPLTLAIIDGFMIKTGNKHYILPLDIVVECTEVSRENLRGENNGDYLNLRGEVVPYLKLRDFFREREPEPDITNIIVLEYTGKKAGLLVDNLVGECQTVVKPLGGLFSKISWISGATILGSGEIALILDVPCIIKDLLNTPVNSAGSSNPAA